MSNYPAIFSGFEAKGVPTDDIKPRENVFTYKVWQAKGRQVQKGEKGVKVVTFIEREKDGKREKFPRSATVFHISQTKPAEGSDDV